MDYRTGRKYAASQDVAMSFEVYEHVKSDFITKMNMVLKRDGYAIVETPNKQVTPLFEKALGYTPDGAGDYEGAGHIHEVGFHELFRDFVDNDFEVVDFDCYYIPVTLWQDKFFADKSELLYSTIHRAAGMFPFYSYIQMFLAKKK